MFPNQTAPAAARAPRQYLNTAQEQPILPGPGLPMDRHVRIAARRSFVDMKQQFISAAAELEGPRGDWLRYQVRHAQEPVDLWLLRGAVFAGLSSLGETARRTTMDLQRVLDTVFPGGGELTPYMPLVR
jgi:hypothetical protein